MPSRFVAINPILCLRAGHSRLARDRTMLDDVYNKRILSLAANIPLLQRLPSACHRPMRRRARIRSYAARP